MKYLKILFSALIMQTATTALYAQGWTNYVTLQNQLGLDVRVSFRFNNLNCQMANGHYRIMNNSYVAKGYFVVAFKYTDCNGNLQDLYQSENLNLTGVNENGGFWFSTNSDNIKDVRLNEAFIPDKKIWVKLVNGVLVDMWKQRYGN
jgi:hypothetical protein